MITICVEIQILNFASLQCSIWWNTQWSSMQTIIFECEIFFIMLEYNLACQDVAHVKNMVGLQCKANFFGTSTMKSATIKESAGTRIHNSQAFWIRPLFKTISEVVYNILWGHLESSYPAKYLFHCTVYGLFWYIIMCWLDIQYAGKSDFCLE